VWLNVGNYQVNLLWTNEVLGDQTELGALVREVFYGCEGFRVKLICPTTGGPCPWHALPSRRRFDSPISSRTKSRRPSAWSSGAKVIASDQFVWQTGLSGETLQLGF